MPHSSPLYLTTGRLSTTERLPDRFLRSGVIRSDQPAFETLGQLVYVIEVESPLFAESNVASTITDVLAHNYFTTSGLENPPLYHFEHAIKRVNQALAELTKTGETDWVGNLHAVIAAIAGRELLLAQTGKARSYIFRKLKVSHITDGLTGETVNHPLKTFSNLISGRLTGDDHILLCNETLLNYLPIDRLRNLVLDHTPSQAAEAAARSLRKEHVKGASAVFAATSNELPVLPDHGPAVLDDVVYLDQVSRNWLKQLRRNLQPLQKFLKTIWQQIRTVFLPLLKKQIDKLRAKQKSTETTTNKLEPKRITPRSASTQKTGRAFPLLVSSNKKTQPVVQWISDRWQQLATLWQPGRRKQFWLLLAGLVAVLFVLTVSIRSVLAKRQATAKAAATSAAFATAKQTVDAGIAAQARQDTSAAQTAFQTARAQLRALEQSSFRPDVLELETEVDQKTDALANIVRLPSTSPISLTTGHKISALSAKDQTVYLYEPSTGSIWLGGSAHSQLALLGNLDKPADFGRFFGDDHNLYLLTSNRTIVPIGDSLGSPRTLAGQTSWPNPVTDAVLFNDTLYLLEPTLGQIDKLPEVGQNFGAGTPYTKAGSIANDVSQLAIDGSVWLLRPRALERWERGKLTATIDLTDIVTKDDVSPTNFVLTDSAIYLLDETAGKIAILGKDGGYKQQLILPSSLGQPQAIALQPDQHSIWAVIGEGLYQFTLP